VLRNLPETVVHGGKREMGGLLGIIIDVVVILILIWGLKQFRTPGGARQGNMTAALALAFAMVVTLYRYGLVDPAVVIVALLAGSAVGWIVAMRVNMIQIPSMVAFQHGAGGVAAFLVSFIELTRVAVPLTFIGKVSAVVGLIVGAATFSGSMLASAKLANKIKQTPTVFPSHNLILSVFLAVIVVLGGSVVVVSAYGFLIALLIMLIIISAVLGLVFAIRIGGADMPVLISFLNATAGLAAAFVGIAIQNRMLIACGATVAASGSILTYVMCKAMNRGLANVFVGIKLSGVIKDSSNNLISGVKTETAPPETAQVESGAQRAARIARDAKSVVIIPGYGMALAHAQFKVVELMKVFEGMGKTVKFAIHPVAGRMPGHMNVLLAEADVPYDKLYEMDDINPEFPETDLALIIGACDVVNPAAIRTEGTPISGMPILNAHEAKHVIVCNLDEKPGYSGVENPLYQEERASLLFGDAKETLDKLLSGVKTETAPPETAQVESGAQRAARIARDAKSVVIIPGYGMALAHAQFKVVELMKVFEGMGKTVKFAIHPVAGRMPGHMNVLLAEADVPYDKLYEMDDINPEFPETDLALIIGACDVVNPAAIRTEGTPISGMPILNAHEAKHVIVCNLDEKPGYSGVENPLYQEERASLLFGDAKETLNDLISAVSA
jgi:NAD(P) transhydrogenase subunit beta